MVASKGFWDVYMWIWALGWSSEGACVSNCMSGATVEAEPVRLGDVSVVCIEVGELGTSAASAAAILRLRSMGVSMDVLTIHS